MSRPAAAIDRRTVRLPDPAVPPPPALTAPVGVTVAVVVVTVTVAVVVVGAAVGAVVVGAAVGAVVVGAAVVGVPDAASVSWPSGRLAIATPPVPATTAAATDISITESATAADSLHHTRLGRRTGLVACCGDASRISLCTITP
ncbi:hypothetical protein ACNTMW_20835 [Planosporangium sp. 12N6]|uniref:hypothetical protein n=1 Tax=Planosporangium spinosum TaxID=3402278 RepID=UPI003CFA8CE4